MRVRAVVLSFTVSTTIRHMRRCSHAALDLVSDSRTPRTCPARSHSFLVTMAAVVESCPAYLISLASDFKFDERVTAFLWQAPPLGLGLEDIHDFESAATNEAQWDSLIKMIPNLPDLEVTRQAGRCRRAWKAVCEAKIQKSEQKKRSSEAVDMDQILDDDELAALRNQFWMRYKLKFPPHIEPADIVVSRLVREVRKRLLTVREVGWVRTLTHQVHSDSKKQRVGDSKIFVETAGASIDPPSPQSADAYLLNLRVLCIAYARAGALPLHDAPEQETFDSDSTDFVECPLDVTMRYWLRAEERAGRVPVSSRLGWLKQRDEAERMRWVEVFRNSNLPLGKVIATVFNQRESCWDPESARPTSNLQASPVGPSPAATAASASSGSQKTNRELATRQAFGHQLALALRSGQEYCDAWQSSGKCNKKNTCKFFHGCAVVMPNGKACNNRGHGAKDHNKASK